MVFFKFILLLSLLWSFYSLGSSQLQASQAQVLLQLKKHLQYPKQLESWYDHKTSFCYLQPSPLMNITCFSNSVSELNIFGDKSSEKANSFEGFAIPNVTLSDRFSIESFVTTLSRLKSLRVLTLASLGIWGHLPEKLHRLSSLEYLDLSNNLYGTVIVKATKNFDKTAILGESSLYGTLYKGNLENGTKVAIRCLPSSKKYSIRNLKLRLELLAKLRHPNLVCLLGHCIDCGGKDDYSVEKVFLIYEYIPNGNFQSCLSDNSWGKAMNWSERLNILTGVAKAVHYLHTGVIPGFFSNRLKTNNVLLNQHRFAKLSDYGLSIVSEATRHNTVKAVT